MNNVVDFGVKKAVRQMDDFKLFNMHWYFENYKNSTSNIDENVYHSLKNECQKEIERRDRISW